MKISRPKCIIILSAKSSGSSALQNLLAKHNKISNIEITRHHRNETLYWTKAASVLNLPQVKMLDSEVPIPGQQAKEDIIKLLSENLTNFIPPATDEELIFEGWKLLTMDHRPIFLEKSPHHLLQWSALELISQCIERYPHIDFLIVGLIRNPMDVLYSIWSRWKTPPEKKQYEWLTEYENLLKSKNLFDDKLVIVRYEDITKDINSLKKIIEFADINPDGLDQHYIHNKSLSKWKTDKFYSFNLSNEVILLAEKFGYQPDEMNNPHYNSLWTPYKHFSRGYHKISKPIYQSLRSLKKKITGQHS